MRKRVAEADHCIVEVVHVAIEPAPVGMDRAQDEAVTPGVLEGLREHHRASVHAGDLETRFEELHGMEPGSGRYVEDLPRSAGAKLLDEEIRFGLRASVPVDQLVPFFDE